MSVHVLVYVIFFNQEVKCLQNSYRFPDNGFNGYIEVKKRNLVNKTLE